MRVQLVSWVLVALYGLGIVVWWRWPQEVRVVDIEASRELELAVPVYAQFVVTQFVVIPTQQRLAAVEIPLAIPEQSEPIVVRLQQGNLVIDEWMYTPSGAGVIVARLELERPVRVTGNLEVVIDGSHIAHANRAQAPAIFIESADAAYPAGHYRIAANDKQGDVALTLIGKVTQGKLWFKSGETRPYQAGAALVFVLLGWGVVAVAPRIVLRESTGEGVGDGDNEE